MMKYTVYKTTNKINEKYYIGKHKTEDLNDAYLGSGKLIKRAVEKYGPENFEKEVLYVFNTPEETNLKEKELVTEKEVKDPNCYNLKEGGEGGWDHIDWTKKPRSKSHCKNLSESAKKRFSNPKNNPRYGAEVSKETRKKISNKAKERLKDPSKHPMFGKKRSHTEETKKKISEKLKENYRTQSIKLTEKELAI